MNELYEFLNQLLCDLTVAARNMQVLHWNLECDEFIYLHPFYGDIYETLADQIDITAERIRFKAMLPHAGLITCVTQSTIPQVESLINYEDDKSLEIANTILTTLNETCNKLVTWCDDNKEWALVNDFSPFLSFYEKTLYFIRSSLEIEEKE